jgi:hypothetical protein
MKARVLANAHFEPDLKGVFESRSSDRVFKSGPCQEAHPNCYLSFSNLTFINPLHGLRCSHLKPGFLKLRSPKLNSHFGWLHGTHSQTSVWEGAQKAVRPIVGWGSKRGGKTTPPFGQSWIRPGSGFGATPKTSVSDPLWGMPETGLFEVLDAQGVQNLKKCSKRAPEPISRGVRG